MKISVFGLGYVGTVSAGCLAGAGHQVTGIDPVQAKVDLINSGHPPIIEADIVELVAYNVKSGRLRATADARRHLGQRALFRLRGHSQPAQRQPGPTLYPARLRADRPRFKDKSARHTVVIRSTILPGTMHGIVIPVLEESSGKKAGGSTSACATTPSFCGKVRR